MIILIQAQFSCTLLLLLKDMNQCCGAPHTCLSCVFLALDGSRVQVCPLYPAVKEQLVFPIENRQIKYIFLPTPTAGLNHSLSESQ